MRSLPCILIETYLSLNGYKKMTNDPEKVKRYIEKCRQISAKPYNLPQSSKLKFIAEKTTVNGMEVFILNQQDDTTQKQILYVHGGSYIEQPVIEHWKFLDLLIRKTGASVIVPIYPKAPDHHFMEAIDNLVIVYSDMLSKSNPSNIVFMGDSAGGGLTLAFAQHLLKTDMPQPKEITLISPWLDVTMENPDILPLDKKDLMLGIYGLKQMGKLWAGDSSTTNPLVSPINGDLKGLGHISLLIGTYENFLPDARIFNKKSLMQNISIDYYEYPKMNHVFPLYPMPEAKKAQQQIIDIINEIK
ncbi:alpha/beta hydrolase fold domain-containing protein [Clostridium saccharoperbutylacetonicum]